MDIWQIKQVKLGDLIPNAKNPRKISQEKLDALQDKIERLGFHNPIKTDENMTVLGGNQRLKALLKIAGKDLIVPVMVPNRPLSEEEKQEVIITDNIADGQWDWEKLSKEWDKELTSSWGLDWSDCDYDAGEEEKQTEIIEDEVPEKVETRCKRGDIWQLGEHRLMCGDSTLIDDVEKLMNGEKADMVFTDMPYGMGLNTDYSSLNWNGRKGKKYEQGKVDDFTPEMISNLFACFDYVKEVFLWGADYFAELLPNKNCGSWIVWDKTLESNGDAGSNSEFELCWSKQKHKREVIHFNWFRFFGLSQQDVKTRIHPTQKPIQVIQPILVKYSKDNQSIVDLFGGSGSTLIACEQLNRKCFMMELDEHYCDVIIQRWENLTGQKAKLLS